MGFAETFEEMVAPRGTMAKLSKATGIPDSLLSRYKKGTDPTLSNACLIADFFGITLDQLAGRARALPHRLTELQQELVRIEASVTDEGKRELAVYARGVAQTYPIRRREAGRGDRLEEVA